MFCSENMIKLEIESTSICLKDIGSYLLSKIARPILCYQKCTSRFLLTGYIGLIWRSTAEATASWSTVEGTLQLLHTRYSTPIAFNERVTFWLQPSGYCLLRVRLLHCMHGRLRNGYTQAYAQIMQHTHTYKAVARRVEAKKLLSRRRQSSCSLPSKCPQRYSDLQ